MSPTFAATFSDGVAVRMSTHCPNGLDLGRGARLAIAAYQSRRKCDPPAMVFAQFEAPMSGEVLRTYTTGELVGAETLPRMMMPNDCATVVAAEIRQIVADSPEPGEMQIRIAAYLRDEFADHERQIAADREIPDA
jgi:hypothetical protein